MPTRSPGRAASCPWISTTSVSPGGERHIKKRLAAEMLGDLHFACEHSLLGVDDPEMLRPDTDRQRRARLR